MLTPDELGLQFLLGCLCNELQTGSAQPSSTEAASASALRIPVFEVEWLQVCFIWYCTLLVCS